MSVVPVTPAPLDPDVPAVPDVPSIPLVPAVPAVPLVPAVPDTPADPKRGRDRGGELKPAIKTPGRYHHLLRYRGYRRRFGLRYP